MAGEFLGRTGHRAARCRFCLPGHLAFRDGRIEAVREGRHIYANLQRAFLFLVAFHVPIVGLALTAPLVGVPILLPIHIVWLELVIHPVAALGISGPVWRLSIEALQKRTRVVRAAADRLSAEFGFAGDVRAAV